MRRPSPAAAAALLTLALVLAATPYAAADDLTADLKERRARLAASLDASTLFIAWSAPPKTYSRDVEYEYRQDSNLLYLTGITQEDTILVLMPGNETRREVLFVQEPNPRREHWNGHMLTKQEAAAASGIDTVYYTSQFEAFVTAMFNREAYEVPRHVDTTEFDRFFAATHSGTAKLALLFGKRPNPSQALTPVYEFARQARERFVGVAVIDATPLVEGLRQVKTPYEQRLLERSLQISSEAHKAGMREAASGKYEYQVEAAIERAYLANGAMSWAYPSIVGSGPNATILHYNASSRLMQAGDLLLVDAAATYQGMSGDITRTYPVSGTFTEAQKDIHRLVVAAQDAALKAAVAGNRTRAAEQAAAEVVRAGLLKLGLVTEGTSDQFRIWYTHGICHWIGLDVHDAGDYRRSLEPGMAFTLEPGIYIREAALDQLPDTPENRAFKEKVRPAVAKYKDIGVRVEDSFLLTESGPRRLSASVPRTVEEIEAFMKGTSTAAR
jgi:Xaa-Pro aminopeptidase